MDKKDIEKIMLELELLEASVKAMGKNLVSLRKVLMDKLGLQRERVLKVIEKGKVVSEKKV